MNTFYSGWIVLQITLLYVEWKCKSEVASGSSPFWSKYSCLEYDQSMVVLEAAKAVSKSLPSMETIICRFSSLNPSSRSSRSSKPSRLWGKVTSVCVKVNQRNYPLMDLRVVKQTGRNQKSQINRYWSTSISCLRIPALFPEWTGKENLQHCIVILLKTARNIWKLQRHIHLF